MTEPTTTTNLEVEINYGQLYVYSAEPWADDPEGHNAVLRALDDAYDSGRFVGVSEGLIDFLSAVQWNFHAPMSVEVWDVEPPADEQNWDHVADVDLDVADGSLKFEGSGGRPPIECTVPSGHYRVRLAGRGYNEARAGIEGMDSYRVQLWQRERTSPPGLRKCWPGWLTGAPQR